MQFNNPATTTNFLKTTQKTKEIKPATLQKQSTTNNHPHRQKKTHPLAIVEQEKPTTIEKQKKKQKRTTTIKHIAAILIEKRKMSLKIRKKLEPAFSKKQQQKSLKRMRSVFYK